MIFSISPRAMLVGVICSSLMSVAQAFPYFGSLTLPTSASSQTDSATDSSIDTAIWPPRTLSVASSASVPGVSIEAYGNASWAADGNSGSVRAGRVLNIADEGDLTWGDSYVPLWIYIFRADFDGQLKVQYDIVGSGDMLGFNGWHINWSGEGGGAELMDFLDPSASGTFTRNIVAGQVYSLGLDDSAGLTAAGGLHVAVTGAFDFVMTPTASDVPEPGNLALFGIAFAGLLGAARRKSGEATSS